MRLTMCAILAVALGGCSSAPAPEPAALAVSGRANATPSLAASGDFVSVVWGASDAGGSTDVYAAISRDGGTTFGEPVRVNDVDGEANLNGEQPPRIALVDREGSDPVVTVVWTAKQEDGTRLLYARSQDGGRSFGRAFVVPGTEAAGNRGWHSVAVAGGRVHALWLDHREMAASSTAVTSHHEHAGAEGKRDGVAMAQSSKLYLAALDGSVAPQAITGGVCYCCKTTVASGADGAFYAAWRHVYPGNIRDIAFTVSRDGGKTFAAPARISEDGWVLDGCPENGPTMVVDEQRRVHVAWPTLIGGTGSEPESLAIFYAMSQDGRQFTPRQQIPTNGVPRHVQIAIASGGNVVLAWDEGEDGTRRVAVARGTPDANGRVQFQREVADEGGTSTYPVIAPTRTGVLTAWTSGEPTDSVIRIERRFSN